jgi:uncharacterized protein YlxW (UPF0749 family)
MSEDQRSGAPGPAADGPGDDDVVPHPFGTGASGGPASAAAEPPGGAAAPGSTPEPVPVPEPVAAPEPAAAEPAAAEPAAAPGVDDAPEQVPEPAPTTADGDEPPPAATPAVARRRRRDPLAAVLIGVLTLLLGFAFAVQVRTADDESQLTGAREEDLVRILDELDAQEERLRGQLAEQRSALEQLTNSDSRAATALEAARQRAEAIGILNGTIAAQGPGMEMVIRDPEDSVGVADLLDAIQELRGAGAETMQIDDVRVGVSTAVTGQPGDLMLDGRPITAPYEVLVIGSPQDMETAMRIPGGVEQRVNGRGGSVAITQSDEVVVDALRQLDTPQYASPRTDD